MLSRRDTERTYGLVSRGHVNGNDPLTKCDWMTVTHHPDQINNGSPNSRPADHIIQALALVLSPWEITPLAAAALAGLYVFPLGIDTSRDTSR